MHGDNTVKNLIIQNCSFNTKVSTNYWKGIYLNLDNGLQFLNNTCYYLNPFGVDNFIEGIKVEGNVFYRNSGFGNTHMIDLAAANLAATIIADPSTWPAELKRTVKDIKNLNTWDGSQLNTTRKKPVRVNRACYGGEADETWLQFPI